MKSVIKSFEFANYEEITNISIIINISISENVTCIEEYAFRNCKNFEGISVSTVAKNDR